MSRRSPFLARWALRPLGLGLLRLQRAALRSPRATLALAALVAVVMAAQVPKMKVHLSIREIADPALRSTQWMARMDEAFGTVHPVVLLFSPRGDGARFQPDELEAIRAWLGRQRASDPEIVSVATPWDALRADTTEGAPHLVPVVGAASADALRALVPTPWGGILTDREGRDVAAEIALRDTPGGSRYGRFDPAPIGALARRCEAELVAGHPGIEARLSGTAAFDHYALQGVRRFRLLNAVIVALLLVLLRVLLGTWRSGALVALTVGWAGLIVYGGMSLTGASVDLLSMGMFLILCVACIEDFLFVSYEQLRHGAPWRTCFRRILLPGFVTSLTTVIGFASLCVSDLAGVRTFGLWAAIGAGLEWVATFLLLPALLELAPRLRRWTSPARALPTGWAERLVRIRPPAAIAWALLLAVHALAIRGALHLDYSDSPVAIFDADHPYRASLDYLRRTRGWMGQLHVVFPEDASFREVRQTADDLRQDPAVARVLDPEGVVRFWTGGDQLTLLQLASERGGLEDSRHVLRGADGRLRASVYVTDVDLGTLSRLRDRIARRFPEGEGFPAGELISYADFGEIVPRTLLESLATCLVLVALVLVGLFRALGRGWGFRAVLASVWGPAIMLAALAAFRLPVNFLTCVFASVLVGLTGDSAVQFAFASARGRLRAGISRRGGAAVLVTLVMAITALVFLGSSFVPPRRLGLLLATGLLAALVGDTWILGTLEPGTPRPPPGREVA